MNILRVQIRRAIGSAINGRVIPEIQNALGTRTSRQTDTESGLPPKIQEDREGTNGFKTKITKKYSRSAFDLRDTENLSRYTVSGVSIPEFLCGRNHSHPILERQKSAHNGSMVTTKPIPGADMTLKFLKLCSLMALAQKKVPNAHIARQKWRTKVEKGPSVRHTLNAQRAVK